MSEQQAIGIHGGCGGTVRIKHWHDGSSRDWCYEAYCDKCQRCDPNGYRSIPKTIAGATEYFEISAPVVPSPGGAATQ